MALFTSSYILQLTSNDDRQMDGETKNHNLNGIHCTSMVW